MGARAQGEQGLAGVVQAVDRQSLLMIFFMPRQDHMSAGAAQAGEQRGLINLEAGVDHELSENEFARGQRARAKDNETEKEAAHGCNIPAVRFRAR